MNKRAAPSANWKEGKRFGSADKNALKAWADSWECDTHNKIHDHRQSDIACFLKEAGVYRFFLLFYNNIKIFLANKSFCNIQLQEYMITVIMTAEVSKMADYIICNGKIVNGKTRLLLRAIS